MTLKDIVASMHKYIECIQKDLKKAEKGNKAASQRVRTCSIRLEKVAKKYRKESIKMSKKKVGKKKIGKKKPAKRVAKRKPARKVVRKKKTKVKRRRR